MVSDKVKDIAFWCIIIFLFISAAAAGYHRGYNQHVADDCIKKAYDMYSSACPCDMPSYEQQTGGFNGSVSFDKNFTDRLKAYDE